METMCNRMCWNTSGWRRPTGVTQDVTGYPREHGFGHEEWNFQTDDAVEGFVYGYLYYRPTEDKIKSAGGHFRIAFWSVHPATRERLVVGYYLDAVVPSPEDYDLVNQVFEREGIYERRAEELSTVVGGMLYEDALQEVINPVRNQSLTFKCRVEDVHDLAQYKLVEDTITSRNLGWRFTTPTFINQSDFSAITSPPRGGSRQRPRPRRGSAVYEDGYYREIAASLRRIEPRHNRLSNSFRRWLEQSGYSNVTQEEGYVDVKFEKADKLYLAELKVCREVGSRLGIREAIGQLLEYNYYPGRDRADRWAIVLDDKPDDEDVEFVVRLRQQHRLPLSLGWMAEDSFVFASGLGLVDSSLGR